MSTYQKVRQNEKGGEDRALTNIDFIIGIIAMFVLIVIGIRHLDDWGKTNIMEGVMALSGVVGLQFIKTRDLRITQFKKVSFTIAPRMGIMLFSVVIIQILAKVPYTIDNIEIAASIVFAAVAEELFFRGFLISMFIEIDEAMRPPDQSKIVKIPVIGKTNLNIRAFGIIGIILSSILFAAIHTNYYDDPAMMISVFLGGMAFGVGYYLWDDMTANIMAHFLLNMIAVGQSGLLVNLSGNFSIIYVCMLFGIITIIIISRKKWLKN